MAVETIVLSLSFGFCVVLAAGLISWAISAVCRLFVKLINEGVKR